MSNLAKKTIVARECRHVTYVTDQRVDSDNDLLVAKEVVHYEDGTSESRLQLFENYPIDFYVTKPGFRNHTDKKLFEHIEKLDHIKCKQRTLGQAIAQTLRTTYQPNLRVMARNQYLYGVDVPSTVRLKHRYKKKWPDKQTLNTVAVCDLETDVVWGTGEILSGTLSFKDRVLLVINKRFIDGIPMVEKAIQVAFEKYLGKVKRDRNITLEVQIAETPAQVVTALLRKAHEWKPDFLTFWNMDYDIPKMDEALTYEGFDPADYFSDPSLPSHYRYYKYAQGQKALTTASGKHKPFDPCEQWHTVVCPASFYVIDAMCAYYRIRMAGGKDSSYSLNAVLTKELGIRKLDFEQAEGLDGLAWHTYMQQHFKIEYLIYNIFDCISVEMLDEKTQDLSNTISVLNGCSDYRTFSSQPRRTCNDLHFFALENDHVIAATSDKMETELDSKVVGTENWIVTLPAHMIVQHGVACMEEFPGLNTNIFLHVADIDVAAAYPNGEDINNISHETTFRELSQIAGVSDEARRRCGINFTGGPNNAVEICREIYKLPDLHTLYLDFEASRTDKQAA
jgi:hypothetical protein